MNVVIAIAKQWDAHRKLFFKKNRWRNTKARIGIVSHFYPVNLIIFVFNKKRMISAVWDVAVASKNSNSHIALRAFVNPNSRAAVIACRKTSAYLPCKTVFVFKNSAYITDILSRNRPAKNQGDKKKFLHDAHSYVVEASSVAQIFIVLQVVAIKQHTKPP
jgi:hypothetical protein